MKKILKLTLVAMVVLASQSVFGQQKFGRINIQELVILMPERAEAQEQLQKINDDYASMLELMQVEFNNKFQEYQKNKSTYSEAIAQVKERELTDLQTRMEELYATANQELAAKSDELMAPIIEKAQNAITKVGKDNGFTIIFDESMRPMAYYNESALTDVLPLVKRELGIN